MLTLLIRSQPIAVSKEDVHQGLWPAASVSNSNLGILVAEIRAAVGDDARNARIIRTVYGFGYAFRADSKMLVDRVSTEDTANGRLVWRDREVDLKMGENVLGRDRHSIVWIEDESVSHRHARIVIGDAGGAVLGDLESKSGTWLRGKKIRIPTRLMDANSLRIGPASMVFRIFSSTGCTASAARPGARK